MSIHLEMVGLMTVPFRKFKGISCCSSHFSLPSLLLDSPFFILSNLTFQSCSIWFKHYPNVAYLIVCDTNSLKTGSNWNMIGKWDIRERTVQIYRTLASFVGHLLGFACSFAC